MEDYRYEPIEPPDSIRILELLPGNGDKVEVRLINSPLSELPTCEALSYEWVERTREHDIICEGKRLKGTSNLLAALRRLRRPTNRRLWVDALCIDQGGEEKMAQLKLMQDVYKKAQRVVIWLREEAERTKEAFELLPRMAASFDTIQTFHFPHYGGLMRMAGVGHGELTTGDGGEQYTSRPEWPAVVDLVASRLYFTRLWTVQEVALADPEKTLVVCGGSSVGWQTFCQAADLITKRQLVGDRNILMRLARYRRLQGKLHGGPGCTLWDCVLATLRHDVSNQHDRIFALIGMVDETIRARLAHLNYETPLAQLFRTATEAMMAQTQNLWHFSLIDWLNPREPSWALWLEKGDGHRPNVFPQVLLKNDPIEERSITVDGDTLNVYGFFLDTIDLASSDISADNMKSQVLEAFDRITDSSRESAQYEKPGAAIEDAIDALWQALTAYEESTSRSRFQKMRKSFLQTICLWKAENLSLDRDTLRQNPTINGLSPDHPLRHSGQMAERGDELRVLDVISPDETQKSMFSESLGGDGEWDDACLRDMRTILVEKSRGRNLFCGTKGLLGIGPLGEADSSEAEPAVKVGDKIVILSKTPLPVILRSRGDGTYSLIGSSYISGLLHISLFLRHSKTREVPKLVCLQIR